MMQAILFILLITLGIGLPLTFLITSSHHPAGRLGLSYILGIGVFTLLMYITNLAGFKLTFLNNIFIFLTVSVPLMFIERNNLTKYWKGLIKITKEFHPGLLEKIMIGAIAFILFSSFVATLYNPIYIWDALTLYDFRAKVFTETGFVNNTLEGLNNGYYFAYPLLTSLSHTIIYLAGGSNPQFVYSLFYLSLGLVFYGQLREFVSKKFGLLFTFMLLSIPQIFNQSVVSYTNLPFMTLFSLGAIYFYIWDKKRVSGYLILSAVLVGLSVWTRSAEPFWLGIFGLVILMSLFRKRFLDILTFSAFFFPIRLIWENFKSTPANSVTQTISSSATILTNYFSYHKIIEVLNYLYQSAIHPWGPVFILFIAAFVYSLVKGKIKTTYVIYLIIFTLLLMVFAGTYIFSFTFPTWNQIPDSVSRMAMIFYPLFVYVIALTTQLLSTAKKG